MNTRYSHINHFIGHLQSNKIKDILKLGLLCLQSLTDEFGVNTSCTLLACTETIDVLHVTAFGRK